MPVSFNAAASTDPDGSINTYAWDFGDNSSATGSQVSHTFAGAGTYTVRLTVTDDRGAQASTTANVTTIAGPVPPNVTVSGSISFERVPFSATPGRGLDFTRLVESPAREVEVELLRDSDGAVLGTTVTNKSGQYQLTAPVNSSVRVRAKAFSRPGAPLPQGATWAIRVRDNTSSDALYVLDGSAFNSCVVDQVRNLKATTGWGGGFSGVYTGPRAAAPFAILDTLYAAAQFVISRGDAGVQLAPLDAFWSPNNVPTDGNFNIGQIGTTLYYPEGTQGVDPGIYVLGAANNDTDEFDQHVVAHEFTHYLEDAVSRTDTVGGPHSLDERLDMRVAFSEGYANAFAGMVLGDPVYRDSFGNSQASDFSFDMESVAATTPGWFNETSVHRIAWDLFDDVNDGADAVALGYGPLHDVFTSELKTGVPLTALFPFITALKQRPGVPAALVDQLVEAERVAGTSLGIVSTTMNAYATTEIFSGVAPSSADLVLPVYTPVTPGGGSVRLCASSSVNTSDNPPTSLAGSYNKLGNRRFLRFSVPSARTIRVSVSCPATDATCAGTPVPDPDFVLRRAGDITYAESTVPRLEELTFSADPGDYTLEIYEWSHVDQDATTRRDRTCMTVNITG